MRSSLRLGRIFGIPISVHITFLLFIVFLGMVYVFHGGPKAALHEHGTGALVSRVMRTEFTTVTADQTLEQVYAAIQACGCTSLPVLDSGRIVGLVTLEALGRYLVFAGAGSGANRA